MNKKVNVLIVSRMDLYPGFLKEIAAVDPRVSVKDGVKQFVGELRRKGVKDLNVDRLEAQADQVLGAKEDMDTLLKEADVIFGSVLYPENLVKRAPNLKWIHIMNVGIDRYAAMGVFDGKWVVTNSRGGVAIPIAESAITYMLMLAKNAPRFMENKKNKKWERFTTTELRDKTAAVIGVGAIGGEIVKLAKGMGMKVVATRRSATKRGPGTDGVDEYYPVKDLHEMLKQADYVVVAAPLTPETRGMIGEAEFKAMKPSAYLINIARGAIVNEPVLVRALKEKWIAGAGLDAFTTEPLPPESELWGMPNVIITSHMSGSSDKRPYRLIELFNNNLRRYLKGEKLENIVTKDSY